LKQVLKISYAPLEVNGHDCIVMRDSEWEKIINMLKIIEYAADHHTDFEKYWDEAERMLAGKGLQ